MCTPSPTITPFPTCGLTPKPCCATCTPTPWPSVKPGEPTMTPLPFPYQPNDGTTLEWRVYPPRPNSTPGPVVLLIHGGSWSSGSPFQPDVEAAAKTIAASGFYVFVPSYRLAPCGLITGQPAHQKSLSDPSGRPPEQTDDVMFEVLAARHDSRCNGKVGIVSVSSGGFLSSYVSLFRGRINEPGRPQWNLTGDTDRPNCVVTFSSPFDISDQLPTDTHNTRGYIPSVQQYTGTCDREYQRSVSPVSLVNASSHRAFRPLFMVQSKEDRTNPFRQIFDMQCALINAHINSSQYVVTYTSKENGGGGGHGLLLWNQEDPNNLGQTIGTTVLQWLHTQLD